MRYDFNQAKEGLTKLLTLADTNSNLPVSSNISWIVSYFIEKLSKKSAVEAEKGKVARLVFFRNYFIGMLIRIIKLRDLTKCKTAIISFKQLLTVLRYTQRYSNDEGIV